MAPAVGRGAPRHRFTAAAEEGGMPGAAPRLASPLPPMAAQDVPLRRMRARPRRPPSPLLPLPLLLLLLPCLLGLSWLCPAAGADVVVAPTGRSGHSWVRAANYKYCFENAAWRIHGEGL